MKSLIIYFSHVGQNYMKNGIEEIKKGNTEKLAEMLQNLTNADIFKVEPKNSYPFNYHECCDVAKEELARDARPELVEYLNNLDDYKTIYIAGPVWWGHYPCAMFSLLERLNFDGKVVKFLTTHEGSVLGDTKTDIERFCHEAFIGTGLAVRGCMVEEAEENLKKWLEN